MSVLLADVAHGRSNNFNLIRVLAASGVIFSHAYPLTLGPTAVEPLQSLLNGVNLGRFSVLVFFATSGFFITASYVNSRSAVDFILARVLRIFPALFIMAILVYSAIGLFHAGGLDYWRHVPLLIAETVTMIRGLHGSYGRCCANQRSG